MQSRSEADRHEGAGRRSLAPRREGASSRISRVSAAAAAGAAAAPATAPALGPAARPPCVGRSRLLRAPGGGLGGRRIRSRVRGCRHVGGVGLGRAGRGRCRGSWRWGWRGAPPGAARAPRGGRGAPRRPRGPGRAGGRPMPVRRAPGPGRPPRSPGAAAWVAAPTAAPVRAVTWRTGSESCALWVTWRTALGHRDRLLGRGRHAGDRLRGGGHGVRGRGRRQRPGEEADQDERQRCEQSSWKAAGHGRAMCPLAGGAVGVPAPNAAVRRP